ncbi:hypothetical protein YC2023_099490 [Brassica napus]
MASSQHSSAGTMRSTGNYDGPVCHCSKSTSISIAWTDANPGRRFYKCDDHGFVDWSDKEPPCLWQKRSLLEARDKIRHLTEEIKNLRQALSRDSGQLGGVYISPSSTSNEALLKSIKEIVIGKHIQSEKKFKQLIIFFLWRVCFATAVIIYIMKI